MDSPKQHSPMNPAYSLPCTHHGEDFDISSAREKFQLDGLEDVYCIADDILVVGQGETGEEENEQHDLNVFALIKRAKERNLKFNQQKFQFILLKITSWAKWSLTRVWNLTLVRWGPWMVCLPQLTSRRMRFCGVVNLLEHLLSSSFTENQANVWSYKDRP